MKPNLNILDPFTPKNPHANTNANDIPISEPGDAGPPEGIEEEVRPWGVRGGDSPAEEGEGVHGEAR